MASLAEIRAKLVAQQNKGRPQGGSGGDNASYPFWNIPDSQQATLRFLPDKDENNPLFWVTRMVIRLPFSGVVGGQYPTRDAVSVTVPCMQMFHEDCPITAEIRPWWQDESKKELARAYYRKKSFIYQGFVVASPFEEQTKPENPIRRFLINQSIHEIIENSLMNPEMEDSPADLVGGRDFVVRKGRQGQWASYNTSSWSLRTRSLSNDEMAAVETHGLWNLADFLGTKPDANGVEMIKAMFHDSLAGKPFDAVAYAPYRAYGGGKRGDDVDVPTTTPAARPVAVSASRPAAAPKIAVPVTEEVEEAEETVVAPVQTAPRVTAPVEEASDDAAPAAPAKADPAAILARVRAKINTGAKG